MRIGITGATGFIGRHLTALARESGEVIAYTRGHAALQLADRTLRLPGDAPHALPETRLDALVHLAGEPLAGLWTREKRDRIWRSRVDFTESLVAHLGTWKMENRPRVLVCASGAGFYGDSGGVVVDEAAPQGAGFLAELCGRWEAAAQGAEAAGMRVVTLRTGMVLGPDGGAYPLLRRVFRLGLGGRLGCGAQWMSWIHIRDAARMILRAVEDESWRGPLNVCAPGAVTNAQFTRALAAAVRRPAFFHAPAFGLRLLLRGMADEMLLGGQRAAPAKALEAGFRFDFPRVDDAMADLEGRRTCGS